MSPRRARPPLLAALAVAVVLALPPAAQADEEPWYEGPLRGLEVAADVVVFRPLAAVVVATGAVLFVPAAVMAAPGGRAPIEEAWEIFVIVPGEQLWGRRLGPRETP